ncbi:MAG: hypothetical protein HPY50_10890 [Firmicutes bacterium]|nr:hypothetical protein [Bacillota bacterium]
MQPVLWRFGGITLNSYPMFLALAGLTLVVLASLLASRRGIPYRRSLPILLLMGLAALVGARLLNYLVRPELYAEPYRLYGLQAYGFSLYGGLVLAVLAGGAVCLLAGVSIPGLADATAPGLGLSIAIMRVGCFLAGCCFGNPTELPWGVVFPMFSLPHRAQIRDGEINIFGAPDPVHPTQLYELLAALCCGAVAYLVLKSRKAAPGTAFAAFFLLFSAFRWFDLGLRYQISSSLTPWFYPALYGTICFLAAFYIIRFNFRRWSFQVEELAPVSVKGALLNEGFHGKWHVNPQERGVWD